MNEETIEHLDSLFNNWDNHIDRINLAFTKIDEWSGKEVHKLIKRYSNKFDKLDLFKEFGLTSLYEQKEVGNLVMIKISCKKEPLSSKHNKDNADINWRFSPFLLVKLSKENESIADVNFRGDSYKLFNTYNLMNFNFKSYTKDFNIDTMLEEIEKIDYDNEMEFIQNEEVSFSNHIPDINTFNQYNSDFKIDSKGRFENETSKAYLEYKKASSKKYTLSEKFPFISSVLTKKELQ